MRHHFSTKKRSFEKTITNSNFALLSFHYCIVQQASSTAKATLTARLMSGNSCTFFVRFYWKSFKHIFVLQTSKYTRLVLVFLGSLQPFLFLQLQQLHPTVRCFRASGSQSHSELFCIIQSDWTNILTFIRDPLFWKEKRIS